MTTHAQDTEEIAEDAITESEFADTYARVFTIPDVCRRLRCSRPHVYRLIKTGQIKAIDVSMPTSTERSMMRVRADDLQRYIDENTFVPSPEE